MVQFLGSTSLINISFSGNPRDPLLPAPGVTFAFELSVSEKDGAISATLNSGSHDGFPSFELFAVREGSSEQQRIFAFDSRQAGQTVFSLFGSGEFTVEKKAITLENK